MRIHPVETAGPGLDAWCALLADGMAAESGGGPDGPALAARARAEPPDAGVLRWAASTPDGIAGVAVSAPEPGARFARVYVPPEHRRRGVGGALLDTVRAAHPGTPVKSVTVAGEPGERFAARRGATVLLRLTVLEQRPADLPPAPPPEASPVFWTGAAPGDLIDSYAAAYRSLLDAPGARHQVPGARDTPAAIRRWEAQIRDAGHELWVCAAVEDGAVVAFTEIEVGRGPAASQHATVVLPAHRRRGLGTAVKAALAARLRADRPGVATVTTTVNADNAPVLALNRRLGYRPVRTRLLLRLDGVSRMDG